MGGLARMVWSTLFSTAKLAISCLRGSERSPGWFVFFGSFWQCQKTDGKNMKKVFHGACLTEGGEGLSKANWAMPIYGNNAGASLCHLSLWWSFVINNFHWSFVICNLFLPFVIWHFLRLLPSFSLALFPAPMPAGFSSLTMERMMVRDLLSSYSNIYVITHLGVWNPNSL